MSQQITVETTFELQELKDGIQSAWLLAYRELQALIISRLEWAFSRRLQHSDFEEISAALIAQIYGKISGFESVEKLKNYVRTACVNMAKSRWRALQADKRGGGKVDTRAGMHDLDKVEIKYGQAEVELDDSQASSSLLGNMNTSEFEWKVFDKISPHDQTQQTDLRNLLLVFMEEMDEDDRQLIRLGFWDELPHKEIAKKMGVSEKSVGSRLNRAVEKLTRKLGTIVKNELK